METSLHEPITTEAKVSVKLPEPQHDPLVASSITDSIGHPSFLQRIDSTEELVQEGLNASLVEPTPAPLLTVVIPVYNEVHTVARVIDSVLALPVEKQVVIVDDGSSDGTQQVLQRYRNRIGVEVLIHAQNQGKGAALQNGFRLAKGDIVIVQRDRHDLHELTCKRLDHDGTNFILRAESTRAEFQEPIVIGNPDEDNHDDEGVNIIGIVLRSHQNLFKRRR